jgi:hypothetical protein
MDCSKSGWSIVCRRPSETKKPSSAKGRRSSPWYHPNYVPIANVALIAITGSSVTDYFVSPVKSSCERQTSSVFTNPLSRVNGIPVGCRRRAHTLLSLLADRMTYYFCHDLLFSYGGPRGIRTLDLLNAIETRSQLRYGPICRYRL